MQTHLLRQWLRLAVAAVAVFFAACGDSDGDAATARVESCELERSSIVGGQIASGEETASLRVIVEVSGSGQLNYTATITSGDWLSLSARDFSAAGRQRQGTVDSGENLLFFYYKANASAQSRIATFTIAFDDGSAPYDFELTQLAPNATDNPYDTPKQWPELPAGKEETDYIYAAHYAKMNLKTVRNYSLCFDKKLRVAHWVAYPLHASYIGSLDRSEAWAPDPKIPQQYQPALWLGGYQNGNVYNRGHQIPSKDRTTVEEMNKQTFYASNMTPQRGQFNQNMWAALEAKVRSYVCPGYALRRHGMLFRQPRRIDERQGRKRLSGSHELLQGAVAHARRRDRQADRRLQGLGTESHRILGRQRKRTAARQATLPQRGGDRERDGIYLLPRRRRLGQGTEQPRTMGILTAFSTSRAQSRTPSEPCRDEKTKNEIQQFES